MKHKFCKPTVVKPIGEDEFTAEMFTQLGVLHTNLCDGKAELNVKNALRVFILGRLLERIDAACDGSAYFQSLVNGAHVRTDEIVERSLRDMDEWLKEFFNPGTERR